MTTRFICVVFLCLAPKACESVLHGTDCSSLRSDVAPIAIHGKVVGPTGTQTRWLLIANGRIVRTLSDASDLPATVHILRTDGYIYPGLIDTHNHPHYNIVPRWQPRKQYKDRYEWMHEPAYVTAVEDPVRLVKAAHLESEALKYGEVRAAIGGVTSLQGTYDPPEAAVLVRNISNTYLAGAFTPDIRRLPAAEAKRIASDLRSGKLNRFFFHLCEGSDPYAGAEFAKLVELGLDLPGVIIIHGITLQRQEFQRIAQHHMYLVWSPRSNLELYGKTCDVLGALSAGVTVALAPDWAVTGSDNMLDELRFAAAYSDRHLNHRLSARDLFRMVTVSAAKVAGLGDLGVLEKGRGADILVLPRWVDNPYENLLLAHPKDIELLMVAGHGVYGNLDVLEKIVPKQSIDRIDVESTEKGIVFVGDLRTTPKADERFEPTVESLRRVIKLAPLEDPLLETTPRGR